MASYLKIDSNNVFTLYGNDNSPSPLPCLLFVGDSITKGTYATASFASITSADKIGKCVPVNLGQDGMYVSEMASVAADNASRYYLSPASNNVAIVAAGTNDIFVGIDAATAYSNFVTTCTAYKSAGFKVVAMTILPLTIAVESQRIAYNRLIRIDPSKYDLLADTGNDKTMGQQGQNSNTTYYNLDEVHPVAAGHTLIANRYIIPNIPWF